jgi:hypothetical protein
MRATARVSAGRGRAAPGREAMKRVAAGVP